MLEMKEAKLIIVSRNIMKVEEKGGFDDFLFKIINLARKNKVPIVYSMTKFQLGAIALKQGFNWSIIGILDLHGALPEKDELLEIVNKKRDEFYSLTAPWHFIMASNRFLEQSRMIL